MKVELLKFDGGKRDGELMSLGTNPLPHIITNDSVHWLQDSAYILDIIDYDNGVAYFVPMRMDNFPELTIKDISNESLDEREDS